MIIIIKKMNLKNLKKLNLDFVKNSKKNFIVKYPTQNIRIDKNTGENMNEKISTKKPEEIKYSGKMEINTDNIDDYFIIGAEIFKNSFKEVMERNKNEQGYASNFVNTITEEEIDKEIFYPKAEPLKWQEPNKYHKHFTRRHYYDVSFEQSRHMFVPSFRHKIEPFNSIHIFKWGLINGDKKVHYDTILKRNSFAQGFKTPFNLNNPELESIIMSLQENKNKHNIDYSSNEFQKIINDPYNNPENSPDKAHPGVMTYINLINSLIELIPNLNFKVLPVLIVKSYFELSLNSKKLWISIEQEILNNLHHYNVTELSQIYYVATVSCPKFTTLNFRKIIFSKIYKLVESKTLSLDDLLSISMGFRFSNNLEIYNKIADNFIERKGQFVTGAQDKKTVPSNLANIIYAYGSHKPKNFNSYTFYSQKEKIENVVEAYEDDLNANIMKMSQDDLWRLASGLYLLKTDSVDPFVNRIERNLLKVKPDKIEAFTLHNLLRSFSKMRNGKMSGSDKFFNEMESVVINHIENYKYNFQEFSDILYAYSVRGPLSEKFNKVVNKKLNADIEQANSYHTIHNITWHYLFTENKNVDQWRELLKRYNLLEGKLPIYYYRPFKIAGYYLNYAFNEKEIELIGDENIFDFKDRFFDPEQIYDYVKYENLASQNPEYGNIKAMMNGRLLLFPIPHFVHKNLFMTHLCWEKRKMGINVWIQRDQVPKSSPIRINQQCYLHSKMMKYEGWEILDIIWEDFVNMGGQIERDKYLHDWFYNTTNKQVQKGIFKSDFKFV